MIQLLFLYTSLDGRVCAIFSAPLRYNRSLNMERRIALVLTGVLVFMSVVQAQDPRGTPGVDYPNYFTIPETSFKCSEQKYNPGFYADLETKCQAFHFCYQDRMESFLCPTGTIFNQAVLTCDVWYKSNCSHAQMFYSVNAGPIMERAGKNLPMLLRLRNRSPKPSVQTATASVFDQVSYLYQKDNETPDTAEDKEFKAESSENAPESSPSNLENKDNEQMNPDLVQGNEVKSDTHEFDSETDNGEGMDKNEFANEMDEADTNMVYDNTGDSYYTNYRQYEEEEWQNSEPVSEEFGNFYDYRNPDNGYGADTGVSEMDYVNGESAEVDSDLSVVEDSDFAEFKKRSKLGHSRLRRKPMYVVLNDQPEDNAGEMTEIADNLEQDTSLKSEMSDGKQTNLTEVEGSTQSPDPFSRPAAIPHSQLNISSETPMTSEEFESAIWSDLIVPGIPDDYEGPNLVEVPDDNQGPSDQSEEPSSPSDPQSDDETIYIEDDLEPESYEPYDSQYEDVIVVPEPGDEPYVDSYSESQEKKEPEQSDMEDTFVVIPDEYDSAADMVPDEDIEMQNYPEETAYRNQMMEDHSPVADYDNYGNAYEYENDYSSNPGYPHYQQNMDYPEMAPEVYQNVMPSDQRYDYERIYESPSQSSMDYVSSDYESESIYSQPEFYPYAEREESITERPFQLPVTEDFNSVSNEDFVYVLDDQPEETWETSQTQDKQIHLTSEEVEEATPSSIPDDYEGTNLAPGSDNGGITADSENSESLSGVQKDDESIIIKNMELPYSEDWAEDRREPGPSDTYYILDSNEEPAISNEMVSSEDENMKVKEHSQEDLNKVDEQKNESNLSNSSDESSFTSNSLYNEKAQEPVKADVWSSDTSAVSEEEPLQASDVKTTNTDPMVTSVNSNSGYSTQMNIPPEILTSQSNNPYPNMGGFDFSTDSRFLNNMGYSESMDFGPYGFGPNMGQFSMMDSMPPSRPNLFAERMGQTEQPKLSPLSAIQEKMRSMKQGKFGAFKKYMSSTRN